MAEPTSSTSGAFGLAVLLTAIGGVAGETLGPWAIVLLGGSIGAAIAVGHMETPTLRGAWWVLVRGVLLAIGFSGIAAVSVVPLLPHGGPLVLFSVAAAIGWRQLKLIDDARALWPFGAARQKGPPDG